MSLTTFSLSLGGIQTGTVVRDSGERLHQFKLKMINLGGVDFVVHQIKDRLTTE